MAEINLSLVDGESKIDGEVSVGLGLAATFSDSLQLNGEEVYTEQSQYEARYIFTKTKIM